MLPDIASIGTLFIEAYKCIGVAHIWDRISLQNTTTGMNKFYINTVFLCNRKFAFYFVEVYRVLFTVTKKQQKSFVWTADASSLLKTHENID